jgi:hypothetical protein
MAADLPPSFVDQPVMGMTEQHQIVEVGAAALRPMHDVVSLHPPPTFAPGEPASSVSVP